MDNLKPGAIIQHNRTGERYKITSVFHKSESVHCLGFYEDGSQHPQRKVQSFTFQQIEKSMHIMNGS